MRVYSIAQDLYFNKSSVQRVKNCKSNVKTVAEPSFKASGWGGTIGSLVGTFAGIGIGTLATIATGGLAAPLLIGMAGAAAGGIGGDMIEDKIDKKSPTPPKGNGDDLGGYTDSAYDDYRFNNY